MATYRAIAATETDPEAPITSSLAKAWADNVIALAECDPTAPLALLPTVLLGTINTTSGTTQTLSSLVLTPYRHLLVYFNGVTTSSSTGTVTLSVASCPLITSATGVALNGIRGRGVVDLNTGTGDALVASLTAAAPSAAVGQNSALRSSLSTASTSISVSITSTGTVANFTAGSVLIYGVK